MSKHTPVARLTPRAHTMIIVGAAAIAVAGCGSGSTPAPAPTTTASSAGAASAKAATAPAHRGAAAKPAGGQSKHAASDHSRSTSTSAATRTHTRAGSKSSTAKSKPAPAAAQVASTGVLAVGRASVNQVVLLHDLAVGATHITGAPPGVGAPQAAQLARTLTSEARQLANMKGGEVSALASALTGYAGLAKQLAARPTADSARLPPSFVSTLRSLDTKWRPAVSAIGQAGHANLLARIAPLLIPPTASG